MIKKKLIHKNILKIINRGLRYLILSSIAMKII